LALTDLERPSSLTQPWVGMQRPASTKQPTFDYVLYQASPRVYMNGMNGAHLTISYMDTRLTQLNVSQRIASIMKAPLLPAPAIHFNQTAREIDGQCKFIALLFPTIWLNNWLAADMYIDMYVCMNVSKLL
jgi:hypothetical protein